MPQDEIHHDRQMFHDNEIARRESIRDMWSQKNQKTQTLMITDTLMFGCGFGLIGLPAIFFFGGGEDGETGGKWYDGTGFFCGVGFARKPAWSVTKICANVSHL